MPAFQSTGTYCYNHCNTSHNTYNNAGPLPLVVFKNQYQSLHNTENNKNVTINCGIFIPFYTCTQNNLYISTFDIYFLSMQHLCTNQCLLTHNHREKWRNKPALKIWAKGVVYSHFCYYTCFINENRLQCTWRIDEHCTMWMFAYVCWSSCDFSNQSEDTRLDKWANSP